MKKKRIITLSMIASVLIAFFWWVIWANTALEVTEYKFESDKLPDAFSGFRIVQISDLHNAEFGENNCELLEMLKQADPDIVVLTGDLIDSRRTNIDVAVKFATEAVKIAPTYFVSGNHEAGALNEYHILAEQLIEAGVKLLQNNSIAIERNGETITLVGIDDPAFWGREDETILPIMTEALTNLTREDRFEVVLAHRPQYFELYAESDADLVLSGHAHGGQFRLPFLGGVYVPSQGLFPKYDEGVFSENGTTMVISRGLGNSRFPIRFNNRPEIVVIELENGD